MPDLVTIDGSYGEGGGQIVRTSLSLAVLQGVPVRIDRVRARRRRPGLQAQHLAAVRLAAQICDAEVAGAELPDQAAPDGLNVLPALLDTRHEKPLRETVVAHSCFGVFSIRRGPWKLILETESSGGWVPPRGTPPQDTL